MTAFQILPVAAAAAMGLFVLALLLRSGPALWQVPAVASALFAAYSLYAVASGGPTGFWTEHTRNAWGVQIWFDLLLAVAVALALLMPRARAQGMRVWPWTALVLGTGCIGLTAMMARLMYLEDATA
ncbi:hypothetical protein KDD17_11440 [Sulfitobacter albidus]|uniref:DUF2834 domain-containing protein n=1 Tax=Sulfitobacter albidus TaxID=2829501 RepID=A0A975PLA2_9RHOB|nr:hypothetical protein [Sulfitobacter albidus]QUJ75572.1 hypothetical protein KDD17_11440 [Sulfitobacter albidus]